MYKVPEEVLDDSKQLLILFTYYLKGQIDFKKKDLIKYNLDIVNKHIKLLDDNYLNPKR